MAGAKAINCFGIIVGYSSLPGETQSDPFVFSNGIMQDLGGLGGSYGEARAVNDLGQVVGAANITGDTDSHAILWTPNAGLLDLNRLIPGNSGWDLQGANAISNNGRIVGAGLHNGQGHAFLLVPAE
jgi:probable HAF family extracellular repeat protein